MRHWSVYDSIIHSRYVAVRLGTWQEKGRDKVDELLVRMGLSQRDCKQDYCARAAPFLHLASLHARSHRQCAHSGPAKNPVLCLMALVANFQV